MTTSHVESSRCSRAADNPAQQATMDSLTEKRAKEALDFIAKKLGYEAMAISFARMLYVFNSGRKWRQKSTLLRATGIGELVIIAHNFKQALMKVLGTTCMASDSHSTFKNKSFTVPDSLEELLMMVDLES